MFTKPRKVLKLTLQLGIIHKYNKVEKTFFKSRWKQEILS